MIPTSEHSEGVTAMAKKMSQATMAKKMRQITDLLTRDIIDDSIFAYGHTFDDIGLTEAEMLKMRRGVEKILGSKFSDDEWDRLESPLQIFKLADRKMRGPRRP
jgi:hypothetical protein